MAMLVVVLDTRDGAMAVDAGSVRRLAGLGVTHVAVARDEDIEAIVLEGWAFEARTSGAEAADIVARHAPHRVLHPVLQTLVSRGGEEALTGAATLRDSRTHRTT